MSSFPIFKVKVKKPNKKGFLKWSMAYFECPFLLMAKWKGMFCMNMNYYYLCFLELCLYFESWPKNGSWSFLEVKGHYHDKCYPTTYGLTESGCNHLNVFPTEEPPWTFLIKSKHPHLYWFMYIRLKFGLLRKHLKFEELEMMQTTIESNAVWCWTFLAHSSIYISRFWP